MSLQSWSVVDQDWSDCWTQAMIITHCFVTRRYVDNEPKAKQLKSRHTKCWVPSVIRTHCYNHVDEISQKSSHLHGNECWLRRWSCLPPVCQRSLVGRVFDNPVLWHMYMLTVLNIMHLLKSPLECILHYSLRTYLRAWQNTHHLVSTVKSFWSLDS